MSFSTLIFDLDGTIGDTLPLCIAAFKKSIEPLLGAEVSEQEIVASFGPSEEGTIRKLIPQQEAAGVAAYLEHYKQLHYICPEPFAGIKDLLDYLKEKHIQLAIVTGKGIYSTRLSLQQFGLAEYFTVLETGSPEGPNKVQGIRNVLNRLQANLGESLYIGDAPSDITYCKQVGIAIAAAAWALDTDAEKLKPLHPDFLFNSLSDFRKWLESNLKSIN